MQDSWLLGTVSACMLSLTIPTQVKAGLTDRGGGLIYDDVLDITWLQDANYAQTSGFDTGGLMTWVEASAWAGGLSYFDPVRNVTYTNWRLPTMNPVNGVDFNTLFSNNATTDWGTAPTTTDGTDGGWRDGTGNPVSEMGHLYYVTWGNLGFCTPNGGGSSTSCDEQAGWGPSNTVPFTNVQPGNYWLDTESGADNAWRFNFSHGNRWPRRMDRNYFAWAVHSGDVTSAPLRCDLNDNDEVDAGDLSQVLQMVIGAIPDDLDCDINNGGSGDGAISTADIVVVTQIVLGVIPALAN